MWHDQRAGYSKNFRAMVNEQQKQKDLVATPKIQPTTRKPVLIAPKPGPGQKMVRLMVPGKGQVMVMTNNGTSTT